MTGTVDDLAVARVARMARALGMSHGILWGIANQDAHVDLTGRTLHDLTAEELNRLTDALLTHLLNDPTTKET